MTAGPAEDTPPEVRELQFERWRAMTPLERARVAGELSVAVAALAEAGIRAESPELDEVGVRYEMVRRRYGAEIADALYRRAASS